VSTAVPVPSSVAVSSVVVVASSSAAASSTSTPSTYKGTKRGLAYNDASLTNAFKGECSWGYNWEHIPKGLDGSFEYIPMLKSSDFYIESWEQDYKSAIDGGSTAVLSLNEPDNSGQANMSPAAAAAFHIANLNKVKTYKSTVQIGAPAVTNSQQAGQGLDWLLSSRLPALVSARTISSPSIGTTRPPRSKISKTTSPWHTPRPARRSGLPSLLLTPAPTPKLRRS